MLFVQRKWDDLSVSGTVLQYMSLFSTSILYLLYSSFLPLTTVLRTMPDHATLPTLTTSPKYKYKYKYIPIPHRLNYPIGARRGRHLSQPGVGHSGPKHRTIPVFGPHGKDRPPNSHDGTIPTQPVPVSVQSHSRRQY